MFSLRSEKEKRSGVIGVRGRFTAAPLVEIGAVNILVRHRNHFSGEKRSRNRPMIENAIPRRRAQESCHDNVVLVCDRCSCPVSQGSWPRRIDLALGSSSEQSAGVTVSATTSEAVSATT